MGPGPLEEKVAQSAASPKDSQERFEARARLGIEKDLGGSTTVELPRDIKPDGSNSEEVSAKIFDHAISAAGLDDELTPEESGAWRARFMKEMARKFWLGGDFGSVAHIAAAKGALESQKPVMTAALAKSLNDAKLGFQVEMRSWMLLETKETFGARLGRTRLPEEQVKKLESAHKPRGSRDVDLPLEFDARQKWPLCADVIGRIHNQGVCGSCWVFAALGPLDSRLCIKTRGVVHNFSGDLAVLSRGYATCCFSEQDDGCDGGWEYMVYDGVERTQGVPTDSCSPYFASPDSAFNETSEAPECPDQCQDTYLRSLDEDYFKPSGVGNYQMVFSPSPEDIELVKAAMYAGGPVAFGIDASVAFMSYRSGIYDIGCGENPANHAIQAIGWGADYLLGQNSWGEYWGLGGRVKVALCVPTDFTIPGDIVSSTFPLPIPDETVIPDTDANATPGPDSDECNTDTQGCVTSPNFPSNYPPRSSCTIPRSFGKINVKSFATEARYDYLLVNGARYSGVDGPQDVVPRTDIVWSSDLAVEAKGWKICPSGAASGRGEHKYLVAIVALFCVWWPLW